MTKTIRFTVEVEIPNQLTQPPEEYLDLLQAIKDRIIEQLAGHRTPRRLADRCDVWIAPHYERIPKRPASEAG